MTPLARLLRDDTIGVVDVDSAAAFAHEPAAGLLLLAGDPSRPEVTDVAVVIGELAQRFAGLRVAVLRDGDEPAMRARFGVTSFPALLFVKGGEVVRTLTRMQAWSAYEEAARAIEGAS